VSNTQTHATYVAIGRVYAMHVMWSSNVVLISVLLHLAVPVLYLVCSWSDMIFL